MSMTAEEKRAKRAEYSRKYNAANRKTITEKKRARRAANPEILARQWARYYAKNPEKYRQSRRDAYAKNPERIMASHRKRLYGLTPEQYNTMLDTQEFRCAICGGVDLDKKHAATAKYPGKAKTLHTDHNHTTGKARGLLCHGCNAMLGYARESIATMQAGIQYLLDHQSSHNTRV